MSVSKSHSSNIKQNRGISILRVFSLIMLLAISISSPSLLGKESAFIHVVTEDAYPMNYEENGEVKGFATDYLKVVLAESGIDYELHHRPWLRAYKKALSDKNTLIYSIARTTEREQKFIWLAPILTLQYNLYGLPDTIERISESELKSVNIGVVNGDVTHEYLKMKGYDKLVLVQDFHQLVTLIEKKRVEFIASTHFGPKYYFKRHPNSDVKIVEHSKIDGLQVPLYYALQKDSEPILVSRLKAAFKETRNHPTYHKLITM